MGIRTDFQPFPIAYFILKRRIFNTKNAIDFHHFSIAFYFFISGVNQAFNVLLPFLNIRLHPIKFFFATFFLRAE
jgi:hypothetical protein